MKLSELPILNDWALVVGDVSPYMAPEQITQHLNGEVTNHPRFKHGDMITTTAIRGKRTVEEEEVVVTNSGTLYRIAEVRKDYEEQFPDSKAKFLATLPVKEEQHVQHYPV